jgi:hypothetical protein
VFLTEHRNIEKQLLKLNGKIESHKTYVIISKFHKLTFWFDTIDLSQIRFSDYKTMVPSRGWTWCFHTFTVFYQVQPQLGTIVLWSLKRIRERSISFTKLYKITSLYAARNSPPGAIPNCFVICADILNSKTCITPPITPLWNKQSTDIIIMKWFPW